MTQQSHQFGCYELFAGLRNHESRLRKAEKISYALQRFGKCQLSSSVCLDVGCSSGIISTALAPLFAIMIGLDYDSIGLAHAGSSAKEQVCFVQGDATCLPLADEAVDVVICAQVYEHVSNDELLIAEIYRVLRPGGVVFFSGPNKLFPIEPHYFLPFLHWLPPRLADGYLRLLRRGSHYYERSRTLWGLQRLVRRFVVRDVTAELFSSPYFIHGLGSEIFRRMPGIIWRLLRPVFPNFNWLLYKPPEKTSGTG